MENNIKIRGAREHNLKNINLDIPRNILIVFTGLSGSGKSTLAFDTIFAEGQRRYLESLSTYARQFLGQLKKPDVDYIEGLSPTISIDQKSASHNPRSTVGTITEIYDYMRLLFARVGIPHCGICGDPLQKLTVEQMVDKILEKASDGEKNTLKIYAPVVRDRKGEYHELLDDFYRRGFVRARVNGKSYNLTEASRPTKSTYRLNRYKNHSIDIFIDALEVNLDNLSRISEGIETALKIADGVVRVVINNEEFLFNQKLTCPKDGFSFGEIEPRLFSFNSPYGACPQCEGLGTKQEIDPDLIIPDKNKTIAEGGILPWSYGPKNFYGALFNALCENYHLNPNARIKDLSKEKITQILYGSGKREIIRVKYYSAGKPRFFQMYFSGIIPYLKSRYSRTESPAVREEVEKYMSTSDCPVCQGRRLKPESLLIKIGAPLRQGSGGASRNISEITELTIENSLVFFEKLNLGSREKLIAERILKEIIGRLEFLSNVGLNYLNLNRAAATLSGGEAQRIRLASQVGSGLTGVLYILDEPTIGLHPRDNQRLIATLKNLRDLGNTVIVIEHDRETIESSDWVVDIGPGAGKNGGEIIANDELVKVLKIKGSLTAAYLRNEKKIEIPTARRKANPPAGGKFISVLGGREHNLKNISVHIPLGMMVCVTGVSGSGKSTLVNDILYKALARKFHRALDKPGTHNEIKGAENLQKIIAVDQSPIGRTPRSNPATYTGMFTPIRELFAKTKEAKIKGYGPSRFSFNVPGGRCEACEGEGFQKIEMQFLPDVFVPCDVCAGKRYNRETLEVKFGGKNISQILEMTVGEALDFFRDYPQISNKINTLNQVGLNYIELGQSATTFSGGEAQRIKLATELSKNSRGQTLYILDEPTTGLHFEDTKKLLEVLNHLIDKGNSIILIEHNLDVIKTADYIIDLGPEGGERGGEIIAAGTPEEISQMPQSYTGQFLKKIFL